MRIFYASTTSPNGALRQSNLWRDNLLLPLRDLGHDVIEFDYDLRATLDHPDLGKPEDAEFIAVNRPKLSAALLDQLGRAHAQAPIDLLFTYFYDVCVLPETIDRIREMDIVAVNWYCNGSYQLHLVSEISPRYDWCLVPEKFRLDDYRRMGAHPIYCQEAANPTIYRPYDIAPEFDVTFVGQAYGERPAYIRQLLDRGIDVRVWGPGWTRHARSERFKQAARALRALVDPSYPAPVVLPDTVLGPPLSDEEMIRMYSRSKINLGFSSVGNTHLTAERIVQVRLRDFEVPMSGGFYMIEYMEELEEFFEIDREIVCYRDCDELADKIKYYLAHDSEREAVARAGYRRAQRDHTWQKRFLDAFAAMGLASGASTVAAAGGTPGIAELT